MLDLDPQERDINLQPLQALDHRLIIQPNPLINAVVVNKVALDHLQEDTLEMDLHLGQHINLHTNIEHQPIQQNIYTY